MFVDFYIETRDEREFIADGFTYNELSRNYNATCNNRIEDVSETFKNVI